MPGTRSRNRCLARRTIEPITPDERQNRWLEIERQLQGIAEGKVVAGDPDATEAGLLAELDELEWRAGWEYFEDRGH